MYRKTRREAVTNTFHSNICILGTEIEIFFIAFIDKINVSKFYRLTTQPTYLQQPGVATNKWTNKLSDARIAIKLD